MWDHRGCRAGEREHILVGPDSGNALCGDGNGFTYRECVIEGQDAAAGENRVRGLAFRQD
jgi:hypothetical protein